MKILLVEDDLPLAQSLQTTLKLDTFVVNHVATGQHAINSLNINEHDMVILDLGLPDIDGFTVLKTIKKHQKHLPVLILTARDDIENKVKGLDAGADDYLVKPFSGEELKARLRVFERRLTTEQQQQITIDQVTLDIQAKRVFVANEPLTLSKKELMVLTLLMENAGRIHSKEHIESRLYEWGEEVCSNAIEVHIHHLRKKLPNKFITTIRGVGYIVGG